RPARWRTAEARSAEPTARTGRSAKARARRAGPALRSPLSDKGSPALSGDSFRRHRRSSLWIALQTAHLGGAPAGDCRLQFSVGYATTLHPTETQYAR